MARIPAGEQFGNVVARAQTFDHRLSGRAAAGAAIGAGLTSAAMDVQRVENEEARVARATQEAADKASALDVMTRTRDTLSDLHDQTNDGIRTGQIDKNAAGEEWATRARDTISASLEGVPTAHRQAVQRDLDHSASRFGRGVRKAVELRDQSDVRSGINQVLEYSQRLYQTDPKAADQLANETLTSLGPFSGMAPEDVEKARQGFRETTTYTKAYSLLNGARQSNKSLDAVAARLNTDEFAAVDPQKKATLLTTLEGFKVSNIQKAESDARRRQAEQERAIRFAETQFNAATSIINTGKVLSPAYVTQVSAAVAGTPYEAALREQLRAGPANAAFGAQPLAVMDRTLTQARATLNTTGTDPTTEKRVRELETIRDQARRDYAADPLLAAQERGILTNVQPVNVSSVQSALATIGDRVQQASLVAQQVGQAVSPLLKAEAEQLGKVLAVLPVDQRSSAVAQIASTMGPQHAAALGMQMAPQDKALGIALGMSGDRTSNGRYTSEIVLRGAQAIKDRAVKEDNTALSGIRARVAAEIGDAYPNQQLRTTMIDAAVYAEYGLQSEGSGDVSRAVRLVTGGITERAGRKLPLPYGVPEAEFNKKLNATTPQSFAKQTPDGNVYVNGTALPAAEFVKALPTAALIHAGNGRYAVQSGAGLATNAAGAPLIIEVK